MQNNDYENDRPQNQGPKKKDSKPNSFIDPNGDADSISYENPEPIPAEALRIPGLVNEIMKYTLATSMYPNRTMAFCGAITMVSALLARKVCDETDMRPNLYTLGIAYSGAGKNRPREVNQQIAHELGISDIIADKLASSEGLEVALQYNPVLLYQPDEMDIFLRSINAGREARSEKIMGTLLTMFSCSNGILNRRRKADDPIPVHVINPHLSMFGTAIPEQFYGSLEGRMLTNGLMGRMIVLEDNEPRRLRENLPSKRDLSEELMEVCRYWIEIGGDSDGDTMPELITVTYENDIARQYALTLCRDYDEKHEQSRKARDAAGTAIWARAMELVKKIVLIYACSENATNPKITIMGLTFAEKLITTQCLRMLYMCSIHLAESAFETNWKKMLRIIGEWPSGISQTELRSRMGKLSGKEFDDAVEYLKETNRILIFEVPTPGRTRTMYKLNPEKG